MFKEQRRAFIQGGWGRYREKRDREKRDRLVAEALMEIGDEM